ncbi:MULTISPECIES: fimbrial protein [Lelliottia]|uniref:fimbrial protein n=1 Tax=Lelliottia TaxID=1330545 RepID=UPI00192BBA16|nr:MULTISPECIES: fimbrial protein [Lelliottia]MBL5884911.1 hypothetical protein [Lelliottia aquatilis]MBL5932743.1 hypothetical protein [Lelliottia amnigena]
MKNTTCKYKNTLLIFFAFFFFTFFHSSYSEAGAIKLTPSTNCTPKAGYTCYGYQTDQVVDPWNDSFCRGTNCTVIFILAMVPYPSYYMSNTAGLYGCNYNYGNIKNLDTLKNCTSNVNSYIPNTLTKTSGNILIKDTDVGSYPYICIMIYTKTWGGSSSVNALDRGQCSSTSVTPAPAPVSCVVNAGQTLDVHLGDSIDRMQLGTVAGVYGVTSKDFSIVCASTATSQVAADAVLKFTSLTGSGGAAIATSNTGLGVMATLDQKPILNNTATTMNLTMGSNPVHMEFTPVHLSSTPVESIATGPFTASATLVLTWQ